MLEIMRDPRMGSFGVLALLISMLLRVGALGALAEPAPVLAALVGAGALSSAAAGDDAAATACPRGRRSTSCGSTDRPARGERLAGGPATAAPSRVIRHTPRCRGTRAGTGPLPRGMVRALQYPPRTARRHPGRSARPPGVSVQRWQCIPSPAAPAPPGPRRRTSRLAPCRVDAGPLGCSPAASIHRAAPAPAE